MLLDQEFETAWGDGRYVNRSQSCGAGPVRYLAGITITVRRNAAPEKACPAFGEISPLQRSVAILAGGPLGGRVRTVSAYQRMRIMRITDVSRYCRATAPSQAG